MSEIIINDVDVSGCEFLTENSLNAFEHSCNIRGYVKDDGKHLHLECCKNPNCYYKQFLKVKNENERLEEGCKVWQQTLERNHYMKSDIKKENDLLIQALKDVRTLATKDVSFENFVKIQNRINEVLNE